MVCLNKILQNEPELKVTRNREIKGDESFLYACKLCNGDNNSCAQYVGYDPTKSLAAQIDAYNRLHMTQEEVLIPDPIPVS